MTSVLRDIVVATTEGAVALIGATDKGLAFLRTHSETLIDGTTLLVPVEALEAVFEALDRDSLETLTLG